MLLIKKSWANFVVAIETGIDNMLCVQLSKRMFGLEKDIVFIDLYNHPPGSHYYDQKDYDCIFTELEQFLLTIMEKGEEVYFLIAGDLNARIGGWGPEVDGDDEQVNSFVSFENSLSAAFDRKSEDSLVNNFGKRLIELCTAFQLLPLNGFVKRGVNHRFTFLSDQGSSVIDYFLCSLDFESCVCSMDILCRIESSHAPVVLKVCGSLPTVYVEKMLEINNFNIKWDGAKEQEFRNFLTTDYAVVCLNEALALLENNLEAAVKKFTCLLYEASECMRQAVRVRGGMGSYRSKWYDRDCEYLKTDARRSLAQYRRSRRDDDRTVYKEKRNLYLSTLKEKKKTYNDKMTQTLLESKNDSKKFWSTVHSLRRKSRETPQVDINTWKNHFERILREEANDHEGVNENETWTPGVEEIVDHDLDAPITQDEVRKAIRNLKSGKATGLDNILAEILKSGEEAVTPFLTTLFNKLYDSGLFPEDWTRSVIIPLLKKGDPTNPENFRGISLLSITSKVFTKILNTRLYKWAEKEEKICEEQAGFRKNHSTIDHIFSLFYLIQKTINSKQKSKVYVAFIDYMKAFDTVNRNSLWRVLNKVKTSTKMLRMLQGMYTSVQSCVRWGATLSDFFDCSSGVRQGCLLSPLIFSLFINEVAEEVTLKGRHGFQFLPGLREIFLLLFADDIALLSSTPVGLQNQLNSLATASDRLGLKINMNKTKVMIFRKGGRLSKQEKWFMKGTEIEIVNEYKYLGFVLTSRLSVISALNQVVKKGKGKVVEILKTMWSLGKINLPFFFRLFDAQVKPMLLYSSEVWGAAQFKVVESVQLFALKRLLSVSPRTPNTMAYGESGRYPLYIDSTLSVIRYWFTLQKMDVNRIPYQVYKMLCNSSFRKKSEQKNWVYMVKCILDTYGFSFVWLHGVGNEKMFLKSLRFRMIDCYRQQWTAKLNGSERFEFYRSFKQLLCPEEYLTKLTISKFRVFFTRFRLGLTDLKSHHRYTTVNPLCTYCDVAEDEWHFMFDCLLFAVIRAKYLAKHIAGMNMRDRLNVWKCLLSNESVEITRNVAMYICYALKEREKAMLTT